MKLRLTAANGQTIELERETFLLYFKQLCWGAGTIDEHELVEDHATFPITLSAKETDLEPALGWRLIIANLLKMNRRHGLRDLWRFLKWYSKSGGLTIEEIE